jgi:hypothetical protein
MTFSDFVYGRPVHPGEFLNREAELRTIFNRLRNGESTAVIGELDLLQEYPDHAEQLKRVVQTNYARRSLERLFDYLSRRKLYLVLLLDEFERLLVHPNFQDPAFFALLRSLATRTGGLVLVIASRLLLTEMNEQGRGLLDTGSPLFNILIEVRLRSFDERTVNVLLDQAGDAFSPNERLFIRRVAGRHPFLLQAMAAALVETRGDDRYAHAAEQFYERVASHFDDVWYTLDERARTTAVILALVELGQHALGWGFATGEIERIEIEHADVFDRELQRLAARELAERVGKNWQFDSQYLLLWRGERWTVGSQVFAWWVRDVAITGVRRVPAYDEWLDNEAYRFLLTREQWDWLVSAVRGAPEWALRGISGLARALFEELAERG